MTPSTAIGATLLCCVACWCTYRLGYDEGRRRSPWRALLNAERHEWGKQRAELVARLTVQTDIAHAALQAAQDLAQELTDETAKRVEEWSTERLRAFLDLNSEDTVQ